MYAVHENKNKNQISTYPLYRYASDTHTYSRMIHSQHFSYTAVLLLTIHLKMVYGSCQFQTDQVYSYKKLTTL